MIAAVACVHLGAAEVADDFEAYAVGGGVSGQGIWSTWDGGGADGVVSDEQALSGTQSLKIVGDNDVVGLFNKDSGIWEVAVNVFVPTDHVGTSFIILMAKYGGPGGSGPDYLWGPQIELNGTSTAVESGSSLPLVTGEWVEVKVIANLMANTKTVLYNGEVLSQGTWGEANALSAIDLYSAGGASAVYYDDLTLTDVTPAEASSTWTVVQSGVAQRFDYSNPRVRGASTELDGFEPGYVVHGSGGDIWGDRDSFTFAYDESVRVTGDFDAQVKIESFTKADGSPACEWGRAGLMLREHFGNGSPDAFVGISGVGPDNNRNRLESISRQNNGTNNWSDHDYPTGAVDPRPSYPLWMRLTRVGNTYTFYWKQNEGDAWTQLRQHPRDWTPPTMYIGFGVQNHNNCFGEPAAVGKFSGLSVTDSLGEVPVQPLAPLAVFGGSAVPTVDGVAAAWSLVGAPAKIVAERVSGSDLETLELPGDMTAAVDDTAPTGLVTYKLTPYDADGLAGGSVRARVYSTGLSPDGHVTSWVQSPLLTQTGGANPGVANMLKDYLAEGGNGPATEANILPVPGTTISPEYSGAAASTGCDCQSKFGCSCNPVTFLLGQTMNGTLDFNDIFNGADNVMNYMVAYVTNHTAEDLPIRFNYQTDDAVVIMIDNTVWHTDTACCYSATGYGILPPGEHRLMLKIFEGGGGHNGRCRLLDVDGSVFPEGTITVSPYTTMESVPDAIPPSEGMTIDGRITDWLLIAQYQQTGGCGPSADFMAQDFLTEGEGGLTEATIVPEEGMEVYTDFTVAASTGCLNGNENATIVGATCDPITVLATYTADGRVNFSTLFGDQNDLMAYMVCYVTNHTDDYVSTNLKTGSDDSIAVKLDNINVRAISACRGYTAGQDQGLMVIPPGTHRLIAKVFEGGGGFDGGVFLGAWPYGVLNPGTVTVSLTPPEGFTVPPAPACVSDLAASLEEGGVALSWTNGDVYDNIVVERKAALGAGWTVLANDVPGDATSFLDDLPDMDAAAVYYRVTPYILDGTTSVCTALVGFTNPGYVVYQEGILPSADYTGTSDAHIITYLKDNNQGGYQYVEIGDNVDGIADHKEGLFRFDGLALPEGYGLEAASLNLFYDLDRRGSDPNEDTVVYVRQVLKDWNQGAGGGPDGPAAIEGEVTWNSARHTLEAWEVAGAYGTADIAIPATEVQTTFGAAPDTWVTFEGEGLAGMVDEWLSGASDNHGFKVTQNPGNDPAFQYVTGMYDLCSSEFSDVTQRPILILSVVETGGLMKPMDMNGDGAGDLSDAVALLNHLFLGADGPPCADANITDAANVTLLDSNGDETIDLSDAVTWLNFLFLGGRLPEMCVDPSCADCIRIPSCPNVCQ